MPASAVSMPALTHCCRPWTCCRPMHRCRPLQSLWLPLQSACRPSRTAVAPGLPSASLPAPAPLPDPAVSMPASAVSMLAPTHCCRPRTAGASRHPRTAIAPGLLAPSAPLLAPARLAASAVSMSASAASVPFPASAAGPHAPLPPLDCCRPRHRCRPLQGCRTHLRMLDGQRSAGQGRHPLLVPGPLQPVPAGADAPACSCDRSRLRDLTLALHLPAARGLPSTEHEQAEISILPMQPASDCMGGKPPSHSPCGVCLSLLCWMQNMRHCPQAQHQAAGADAASIHAFSDKTATLGMHAAGSPLTAPQLCPVLTD